MTEIGYGTTFKWNTQVVGALTKIGGVGVTLSKVDSTTLSVANYYKTMLPGLLDPGDVELEGWFLPSDTGQVNVLNDMKSRTQREWIVTFPAILSSATWTGNGYITAFKVGDATPEGIIPWTAILSITGEPVLGVTLSAGMTVMTGIEQTATAALVIVPTVGVAVYTYVANPINAASTWIKLTITAVGIIRATVLGVEYVLVSTVQSGALVIDAAGTVTPVYIKVQETLKSPRNYTLYIQRP